MGGDTGDLDTQPSRHLEGLAADGARGTENDETLQLINPVAR